MASPTSVDETDEVLTQLLEDSSSSSSSSSDDDEDGHFFTVAVPFVTLGIVAISHAHASGHAPAQGHRVKRMRVRERARDPWQSPWGLLLTTR